MIEQLRAKVLRRAILALAAVFAVVMLSAAWWIVSKSNLKPPWSTVLLALVSNVFAVTVTSGLVLAFIHVFIRVEEERNQVEVMEPRATWREHGLSLNSTDCWHHHGHIGRWVRRHSLTKLAAEARENGAVRRMTIMILDPSSEKACEDYARRRNQTSVRGQEPWTTRDVQAEICATILSAVTLSMTAPSLQLKILLHDESPAFRIDLCSKNAFFTHEEPSSPAIVVGQLHPFYEWIQRFFEDSPERRSGYIQVEVGKAAKPLEGEIHAGRVTWTPQLAGRILDAVGQQLVAGDGDVMTRVSMVLESEAS